MPYASSAFLHLQPAHTHAHRRPSGLPVCNRYREAGVGPEIVCAGERGSFEHLFQTPPPGVAPVSGAPDGPAGDGGWGGAGYPNICCSKRSPRHADHFEGYHMGKLCCPNFSVGGPISRPGLVLRLPLYKGCFTGAPFQACAVPWKNFLCCSMLRHASTCTCGYLRICGKLN